MQVGQAVGCGDYDEVAGRGEGCDRAAEGGYGFAGGGECPVGGVAKENERAVALREIVGSSLPPVVAYEAVAAGQHGNGQGVAYGGYGVFAVGAEVDGFGFRGVALPQCL